MTHTLSAKEQPLDKIFSNDYVFTIPGYQRPYAWGTEQAQELLDDLLGALPPASTEDLQDAPPYFLGSVVLIKRDTQPDATVVDGQQRLTTLTLLLSAIRATTDNPGVQSGITKRIYEQGDVLSAAPPRYRLLLRERDRDFFRQYVQHEEGIGQLVALTATLADAQERLRANAALLMNELRKLPQPTLLRLVQFIMTRCYLVTVATPDLDSAYRIFGVLNSRGLDLSATDILKAEIIGAIEANARDRYTQQWEDTEETLGRDLFGDLFSHIRMVYRKVKPKSTLLKEFREHVGPAQPKLFMEQVLAPMARAFSAITSADYASQRHAEAVNEHLRWLGKLEFQDWVPPALAFFTRQHNDPEAMQAFFADLERLAYAMLARKSGVNERIERFAKLTQAIEEHRELHSPASPLQLNPQEQFATYEALAGPIYDTHSARAMALILLRLDRLLSDASASYQHDVVSVEHVMPQTPLPRSQWVQWVARAPDRLYWVHRLGNLALLNRKKNSAAKNYDFDKKKTAYFTKGGVCSFALTTQVLQHAAWPVEVMQSRQEALLATLETHWRLQERQSEQALAEALLAELARLAASGEPPVFELHSAKHSLSATAREVAGQFVVAKGSHARAHWQSSSSSYQPLHAELVAQGKLRSESSHQLVFSQDVAFKSPSAAAAVVLGRSDNGRMSWRLRGTAISYAAWQKSLPAGQRTSGEQDDEAQASGSRDSSSATVPA